MLNSELECIYNNHFNRVLAYFSKRLPIAMDAEDLTAETFVYAFSHIDQFDPEKSPISAWIFLIASSRLKNFYRDRKINVSIDAGDDGETLDVPVEDPIDGMIDMMHKRRIVYSALMALPDRDRKVIVYKYFLGKSGNEIADAIKVSTGNVRVITMRALQKMKTFLINEGMIE